MDHALKWEGTGYSRVEAIERLRSALAKAGTAMRFALPHPEEHVRALRDGQADAGRIARAADAAVAVRVALAAEPGTEASR